MDSSNCSSEAIAVVFTFRNSFNPHRYTAEQKTAKTPAFIEVIAPMMTDKSTHLLGAAGCYFNTLNTLEAARVDLALNMLNNHFVFVFI